MLHTQTHTHTPTSPHPPRSRVTSPSRRRTGPHWTCTHRWVGPASPPPRWLGGSSGKGSSQISFPPSRRGTLSGRSTWLAAGCHRCPVWRCPWWCTGWAPEGVKGCQGKEHWSQGCNIYIYQVYKIYSSLP